MESSSAAQTSLYSITLPTKRKRRPAGTPDADAEVVALSPRTLMESDSYVCEICNQGFQRDQNLQMHRRRHKVPWKLLKRLEPEARKRVYVCPEPSCLHHNPCHALGDMVGIKKHYRRKHSSMRQWECDRCSKAYAVQSDYKAHLKTCGTRGHCCDCGRVFSRIESFIEHQDKCTTSRAPRRNKQNELEATRKTDAADACIAIRPTVAPPPCLSPVSPPELRQRSPHHIAISTQFIQNQSMGWQREQPCISLDESSSVQHDRVPELQLLPTSGSCLVQEKDVSPNSCSQTPAAMLAEDKRLRSEVVDFVEMLPASTDAAAPDVCCNLQLAIGMLSSGQLTNSIKRTSLQEQAMSCTTYQVGRPVEQLYSKAVSCTQATWSAESPFLRNISEARRDVVLNCNRSLSCSQRDGAEVAPADMMTSDHYNARHGAQTTFDESATDPLQMQAQRHSRGHSFQQSKLFQHCSSVHKAVTALQYAGAHRQLPTEQSESSTGSIKNPDSALPNLQLGRASSLPEKLSFLANIDHSTELAANAAEIFLQEAREKLRRASVEKQEAEKALREARRERELAEQELAKAQRLAGYNIMGRVDQVQLALQKQGGQAGTRKSTCSSSTSSSPCSSVANTQAPTSSLPNRQAHVGDTVLPACITCPTCLHTQILYPSPATASKGPHVFL